MSFFKTYYFIWRGTLTGKYYARSNWELGGLGKRCSEYGEFDTRFAAETLAEELNKK